MIYDSIQPQFPHQSNNMNLNPNLFYLLLYLCEQLSGFTIDCLFRLLFTSKNANLTFSTQNHADFMLNPTLSNMDIVRYFSSSCPSELLRYTATSAGNMAWAGIAIGTQSARDASIYTLGFTVVTGITYVLAKKTVLKKPIIALFVLSLVPSALAMINLYNQATQLQSLSGGWDSQYPNVNLSFIIDACNKV